MLRALWIGMVLVASCKGREPGPEPKATATVRATAAFVDVTLVPMVATMIPFADRAKEGAKITVAGKSLAGTGKLSNVAYSFERAGRSIPFTVTSMFGEARGTYEVDAQGIPTSIKLQAGPGEIVITRK